MWSEFTTTPANQSATVNLKESPQKEEKAKTSVKLRKLAKSIKKISVLD
jgi:hypothetical protein